ncbi:MAG: T9SS type A sorting domain-containing protein [Calditrichaceae bacterium]
MKTILYNCTFVLLFINLIISQTYSSHPLITRPGNNYNFDVLYPLNPWQIDSTFICWINENDSIYTLYLKQISPTIGEEIIIAQDSTQKANPQISGSGKDIRISWQNKLDNYWQIWFVNFTDGEINSDYLIRDSLENDPQITMNSYRIAWIEDGNILLINYFDDMNLVMGIDSSNCSGPNLGEEDYKDYSLLVYEKGEQKSKEIYFAELNKYHSPEWQKTKISEAPSRNPRIGFWSIVSFQIYQDNFWSIVHGAFYGYPGDTIKIPGCNLNDPESFTYPIPTMENDVKTHPFVVFEKELVGTDTSDIFIMTYNSAYKDTFINVSKTHGINYSPQITYLVYPDSIKIAIVWVNEKYGKKNIWISETMFNPVIGDIKENSEYVKSFELSQNYPNPFNPITNIEYFVSKPCKISLTIYNVLGEKIETFSEGFKNIGRYKIQFDGQMYPSGIYYYRLESGNYSDTKSMLLIK